MPGGLLRSFEYSVGFLSELVSDVPDDRWTEQPAGMLNHGAWVVGHLAYSCQAVGGEMGLQPWLPPQSKELYGTGSRPENRRDRYPSGTVLLDELHSASRRVADHLRQGGASLMSQPLPDARYRSLLPTVGDAAMQVLVAHSAYHVGQTVLWRKAIGMPTPNRFYL